MFWDDVFKSLAKELGREPTSGEVQRRLLDICTDPSISRKLRHVRLWVAGAATNALAHGRSNCSA